MKLILKEVKKYALALLYLHCCFHCLHAQRKLPLREAIDLAVDNYGVIKAKASYRQASGESVKQAIKDYFPNVVIAAQQDYGTINGQNGPLYGFGGYGVASSGLPLSNQNWNAAFGALYLANVNWDVFAFGRAREKIEVAKRQMSRDSTDWQQEIFQHKVKVTAAYLNLAAAQKLTESYRKNLNRADTFRRTVVVRSLNGLNAGVDSSQANAEVSNAKIALTKALDFEQEQSNKLIQLLGTNETLLELDTFFVSRLPRELLDNVATSVDGHPLLQWYQSRINLSDEQSKYYNTFKYPTVSIFGVFQGRGSGFYSNYATDQSAFTSNYFDGISPDRMNYLLGVGISWNLTQPFRMRHQVRAQNLISRGLAAEYEMTQQQLNAQLVLANQKLKNALDNYLEAPVQVKAASDTYLQRSVLYKNGLTNLVDVTQALYLLIRAETDRDIAYNNVWQALLLKAAASGDFDLFLEEI
ncbi:TolC family protein [Olivibacter sitiensis]|uniref:TolC family protein n=1 Tax=Olivibacter sitiensis TaxID=376470 RepID=UPI000427EF7B|nr:TolC family protein [Olivibacter sitiensis]